MAFTWTARTWTSGVDSVTKGSSKVLATHITELRTNASWIKDNTCSTHNSTVQATNKATHYNAENTTHQSSNKATDKAVPHFSTDKSLPHYSNNKVGNHSTVKTSQYGVN